MLDFDFQSRTASLERSLLDFDYLILSCSVATVSFERSLLIFICSIDQALGAVPAPKMPIPMTPPAVLPGVPMASPRPVCGEDRGVGFSVAVEFPARRKGSAARRYYGEGMFAPMEVPTPEEPMSLRRPKRLWDKEHQIQPQILLCSK